MRRLMLHGDRWWVDERLSGKPEMWDVVDRGRMPVPKRYRDLPRYRWHEHHWDPVENTEEE